MKKFPEGKTIDETQALSRMDRIETEYRNAQKPATRHRREISSKSFAAHNTCKQKTTLQCQCNQLENDCPSLAANRVGASSLSMYAPVICSVQDFIKYVELIMAKDGGLLQRLMCMKSKMQKNEINVGTDNLDVCTEEFLLFCLENFQIHQDDLKERFEDDDQMAKFIYKAFLTVQKTSNVEARRVW